MYSSPVQQILPKREMQPREDQPESEESDTESRDPVVIVTDPFTRQDLITAQKEDEELQPLFEAASDSESDYMVDDEVLYAINRNPTTEENPYKIVVPEILNSKILELGHGKSGHFGCKKTRRHIQSHFYWKGIGKDIQQSQD